MESTGLLDQWRLQLSEFDFDVIRWADMKHLASDELSRLDTNGKDATPLEDDIPLLANDTQTEKHNNDRR